MPSQSRTARRTSNIVGKVWSWNHSEAHFYIGQVSMLNLRGMAMMRFLGKPFYTQINQVWILLLFLGWYSVFHLSFEHDASSSFPLYLAPSLSYDLLDHIFVVNIFPSCHPRWSVSSNHHLLWISGYNSTESIPPIRMKMLYLAMSSSIMTYSLT